LRITSQRTDGWAARVWLDDVDISHNVTNVELGVDSDSHIKASITVYVAQLDLDVVAKVLAQTPIRGSGAAA
jgi:hypothetical protein